MDKCNDITSAMFRFRESVRHNWNTYFQDIEEPMGPDIQDAFDLVEQGLFQGIVIHDACSSVDRSCRYRSAPLPFIQVVPTLVDFELELMLQIRFIENGARKVRASSLLLKIDGRTKLEFFRFFDWIPNENISMSLVEVNIARMDTRPDLVGTHAFVNDYAVRFLFVEPRDSVEQIDF